MDKATAMSVNGTISMRNDTILGNDTVIGNDTMDANQAFHIEELLHVHGKHRAFSHLFTMYHVGHMLGNWSIFVIAFMSYKVFKWSLEKLNPTFRFKNGHRLTSIAVSAFLVFCPIINIVTVILVWIACHDISNKLFIQVLAHHLGTLSLHVATLSSVYVSSYASAILAHRAEAEPDRSRSHCIFASPSSFYSLIRECVYIGIFIYLVLGNINMLIGAAVASIIATAIYDSSSISSLCSNNCEVRYKGIIVVTIMIYLAHLYMNVSRPDPLSHVTICTVLSMFLSQINFARFITYSATAKNDLVGDSPFRRLYNLIRNVW